MMLLKDMKDVNLLISAVEKCKGDVVLRSIDGSEEFNLKSKLSQYIAISKLCDEHGDEYEVGHHGTAGHAAAAEGVAAHTGQQQ